MINIKKERSNSLNQVPSLPKVTIITAVYNAEKYLKGCISSILNQSYKNFEYIIIDGGSTDKTLDIIKEHNDKLAYWVSEPDQGIYDAWNKGLSRAKGEWIAFVGSDDLLNHDALQTYMQHISQHPEHNTLEFVSSRIELVNEDLSFIRTVGEAWDWDRFQHNMITWHVGAFHSKNLFETYGVFDTTYKISGDYELLLRPKAKLKTSFINQTTVIMRTGGISDTRLYKAIDETYRAKMKNEVLSTVNGKLLRIVDKVRLLIRRLTGWGNF